MTDQDVFFVQNLNKYMIEFKIIKEIEIKPEHTQRSLAKTLNISLGKVNYILSGLIDEGLVRAKKLTNQPQKIKWNYILTPKGIKKKIQITKNYLSFRMKEFDTIKQEIQEIKNYLREKD